MLSQFVFILKIKSSWLIYPFVLYEISVLTEPALDSIFLRDGHTRLAKSNFTENTQLSHNNRNDTHYSMHYRLMCMELYTNTFIVSDSLIETYSNKAFNWII